jgi:deazaflavin-dependent oxidoreductase (nitroreductase family)
VADLSTSRSTVVVTHRGRKTGKPYNVTLWFVQLDGDLWIGSLDAARPWVRNVRAAGTAEVDLGDGPQQFRCEWIDDGGAIARFRAAIQAKHPIMYRLIQLFQGRGCQRCAFKLTPISVPARPDARPTPIRATA